MEGVTDLEGVVAVIRAERAQDAVLLGRTLSWAGVAAVEITWTVPDADRVITELLAEAAIIGAGTVRTPRQCDAALVAGAQFVVAPDFNAQVVEKAKDAGAIAIPGALTPSEVGRCLDAGADVVKVFPAAALGGPAYIRTLSEPFPNAQWMVSGGVRPEDATSYRTVGVRLLALGGALIDKEALARGDERALVAHAAAAISRAGAAPADRSP